MSANNKNNNNEKGYMAIKDTNLIIEYITEEDRKKLCSKNRGKKFKTDSDYGVVEKWLLTNNHKLYKVKCDKMYFYYDIEAAAEKRAKSYRSKVEKLAGGPELSVEGELVSLQEANNDYIDNYIDKNVQAMVEFIQNLNYINKELYERLSILDKKVVDIEHAMEFQKLDAAGGYKLYKLMHDTLNERRVVKDNLKKIENLQRSQIADNIKIANKSIKKIENQKYSPRVLTELFA